MNRQNKQKEETDRILRQLRAWRNGDKKKAFILLMSEGDEHDIILSGGIEGEGAQVVSTLLAAEQESGDKSPFHVYRKVATYKTLQDAGLIGNNANPVLGEA